MTEMTNRLDALEAEIRRLRDIEDIRALTAQAAWATDTMDGQASWALWADRDDLVFDLSGLGGKLQRFEGRDAVRGFILREDDNPWSSWNPVYELHLLGNHLIEVDGDEARCRYASLGYLRNSEHTPFLNGIRYDYELVRAPAGWRVLTRAQTWIVPPEDRLDVCPPPQPHRSGAARR